MRLERPWRTEPRRQAIDIELPEPDDPDVLEPVPPEVGQGKAGREQPGHLGGRPLGQDDLAAVGGVRDPCRPMDVDPDVVVARDDGMAHVDPDPDAEDVPIRPVVSRECALRRGGRHDAIERRPEDGEERVALGRDLEPAVRGEGRPDVTLMFAVEPGVAIAEVGQQPGAALDVAEEEEEPSAREITCVHRPRR